MMSCNRVKRNFEQRMNDLNVKLEKCQAHATNLVQLNDENICSERVYKSADTVVEVNVKRNVKFRSINDQNSMRSGQHTTRKKKVTSNQKAVHIQTPDSDDRKRKEIFKKRTLDVLLKEMRTALKESDSGARENLNSIMKDIEFVTQNLNLTKSEEAAPPMKPITNTWSSRLSRSVVDQKRNTPAIQDDKSGEAEELRNKVDELQKINTQLTTMLETSRKKLSSVKNEANEKIELIRKLTESNKKMNKFELERNSALKEVKNLHSIIDELLSNFNVDLNKIKESKVNDGVKSMSQASQFLIDLNLSKEEEGENIISHHGVSRDSSSHQGLIDNNSKRNYDGDIDDDSAIETCPNSESLRSKAIETSRPVPNEENLKTFDATSLHLSQTTISDDENDEYESTVDSIKSVPDIGTSSKNRENSYSFQKGIKRLLNRLNDPPPEDISTFNIKEKAGNDNGGMMVRRLDSLPSLSGLDSSIDDEFGRNKFSNNRRELKKFDKAQTFDDLTLLTKSAFNEGLESSALVLDDEDTD